MSKTILLFPGQGAQYVGMGRTLASTFEPAKKLMQQADEILGFSLSKLMAEGPEDVLKSTDNTQPALFTVSAMVMELLKSEGFAFDYVAGHSLGEYSAIYAAGGFSFEEGLRLVRTQDEAKILELCEAVKDAGTVVPANINCPGQIVVSGAVAGVNKLVENCGAAGIKAIPLAVSGAFHSPLMQFAQAGLAEAIAKTKFNDVEKPVIANVIAEPVTKGAELAELLVKQLVSPVRWNDCMNKAMALGVTQGVEVGSGKVLMGLMRKISRDVKVTPVETIEAFQALKG